jgi:hypothetical protein
VSLFSRIPCLSRHLTDFIEYYHHTRCHLALNKDAPEARPVQPPALGALLAFRKSAVCSIATNGAQHKRWALFVQLHSRNDLHLKSSLENHVPPLPCPALQASGYVAPHQPTFRPSFLDSRSSVRAARCTLREPQAPARQQSYAPLQPSLSPCREYRSLHARYNKHWPQVALRLLSREYFAWWPSTDVRMGPITAVPASVHPSQPDVTGAWNQS